MLIEENLDKCGFIQPIYQFHVPAFLLLDFFGTNSLAIAFANKIN